MHCCLLFFYHPYTISKPLSNFILFIFHIFFIIDTFVFPLVDYSSVCISLCNLPPLSNTQFLNLNTLDMWGRDNSSLPCEGLSCALGVLSLAAFLDSHVEASSSPPYSSSWITKKCFQTLQNDPWAGQGGKLFPVENRDLVQGSS